MCRRSDVVRKKVKNRQNLLSLKLVNLDQSLQAAAIGQSYVYDTRTHSCSPSAGAAIAIYAMAGAKANAEAKFATAVFTFATMLFASRNCPRLISDLPGRPDTRVYLIVPPIKALSSPY